MNTAAGAAIRVHNAKFGKILEYLGEKSQGSVRGFCYLTDKRYRSRRLLCQIDDTPDGIFALPGKLHHIITVYDLFCL